jgi:hypothetical protein
MTATLNASTTSGVIVTSDTSGSLALQTANTTALTISSGQVITASGSIGIGGTTPSGGGVGIAFPATQSASTDANTLDDYEEGSWTPTDGSGAGISFTIYSATYTKIGNTVRASFALSYGSTSSGSQAQIGGLPFATSSNTASNGGFCSYSELSLVPTFMCGDSATYFYLYGVSGNGVLNITASGKGIRGTIVYKTA